MEEQNWAPPGTTTVDLLPDLEELKTAAEKIEEKARAEIIGKVLANITPELVGGLLQEIAGTGRILPVPSRWEVPNAPYWWRNVLAKEVISRITPDYIRQNEPWLKRLRGEDSYFHQPRWTAVAIVFFTLIRTLPELLLKEPQK